MKSIHDSKRSDTVHFPFPVSARHLEIKTVKLENICDQIWGSDHALKIKDTPHFKYLEGDTKPLRDYFQSCRGHTWARKGTPNENMTVDDLLQEFEDLITCEKAYLEPPFQDNYIIVRSNWQCIDGLRRACVLLYNGVEEAPVAWVS